MIGIVVAVVFIVIALIFTLIDEYQKANTFRFNTVFKRALIQVIIGVCIGVAVNILTSLIGNILEPSSKNEENRTTIENIYVEQDSNTDESTEGPTSQTNENQEVIDKLQPQESTTSRPTTSNNNETEKLQALQQISQYESQSDFAGGIKYINSLPSTLLSNTEIASKLNYFKGCYREQVLDDAEKAFNSSGYAEAINVLNNATTILPNDETIQSKIEYYQSFAPVPIKSIIMKSSSNHYNFSTTEYDPRGKMYTNVVYLYSSATNGIGYNGKLELYTEKKYSTFKCTFVPEANYSTNSGAGAYVEIYKDGILAYTSELITYKTTGIDVSLDIRNTEYLKIKLINVNPKYPYMAYADTLLCDAYVIK